MKKWLLHFLTRKVHSLLEEAAGQPGVSLKAPSIEDSRRIAKQLLEA